MPCTHGDFTAEVMAQARPNGRVLDHCRIALGSSKPLEAERNLAAVIPAVVTLPKWRLTYQQWPRDVILRRNMTTQGWVDLRTQPTRWVSCRRQGITWPTRPWSRTSTLYQTRAPTRPPAPGRSVWERPAGWSSSCRPCLLQLPSSPARRFIRGKKFRSES